MVNYFNDSPIDNPEDDLYGILPFAKSLAKSIRSIDSPIGTTIALNGPWGAGKSSAVNFIRNELEKSDDETLYISDFKCWWYRGEEALALAFLQNLNAILTDTFKDKVKDLVPKLGRNLLQAGPVIGSAMSVAGFGPLGAFTTKSFKFTERFFSSDNSLEKTFQKLAEILATENRRFLIIIDDIDRLKPEEALAIFRVVKSVGRLPNIMYLLVFDRELAERAVNEHYPSEGPHFLEKIIQASFELPAPLRTDINHSILSVIERVCGKPNESEIQRLLNIFFDVIQSYLTTPRDVARFQNAISVTWPAIANEVCIADFVAMETLRLYEPKLFQTILANKSNLCGSSDQENRSEETRFDKYLHGIDGVNHRTVKLALQRLFPRMEDIGYGSDWFSVWGAERRICVESHFSTYFRLSLTDESLSIQRINELIERSNDVSFIKSSLLGAAQLRRSSGTSMVPVYLDELNTHADRIDVNNIEPFLKALFEVHDRIDLDIDKDRGMWAAGNTTLRYHWLIRRLARQRFTLAERTDIFRSALTSASMGWLVDFARSARAPYLKSETPPREDECLTTLEAVEEIEKHALAKIRVAASDQSLLQHKDLIDILYRWGDFLGNDFSEVRAWTDPLLENDNALVILAKALIGESFSQGMGMFSLADRVAKRTIRATLKEDSEIVDAPAFITALERLMEKEIDENSKFTVRTFLDAWHNQQQSDR